MTNLDVLKSIDITLLKKVHSQSYGFSSSHVCMWELEHKESWVPKKWCFQIVVLEKTVNRVSWTTRRSNQSILKEINPGHSLEELMLSWSSNTLATWCQELTDKKRPCCWERLKAEGEGDNRGQDGGWHHQLNGHEFEQTLGVGDGQGSLVCCSPWGHKELDHNEGWATKNWCFWTVVLEKTLESPLDCKEIKPVNPKGSQPWIFLERTDIEA